MSSLEQIAADLAHAAAAAPMLGRAAVADARVHAEIGAAVGQPGPGLTQLLGRSGHAATEAETRVDTGELADGMAVELADGGVDLVMGRRR